MAHLTAMNESRDINLFNRLISGGHEMQVRIYYEDTDFSGVVYHANYLRYMERGRSDLVRLLGIDHVTLEHQEIVYAVHRLNIRYIAGARIDDLLTVRTFVIGASGARLFMRQEVSRQDKPVAVADVEVALINKSGRPVRLPDEMQSALAPLIEAAKQR